MKLRINLHDLAVAISKSDNPAKRNEDIIAAETILAQLGRFLRWSGPVAAFGICWAIYRRAGRKSL
jgi:hypothetical protein